MPMGFACRGFALMCALAATASLAQEKRPWKGYSILGDENVTVVYSDDTRITNLTHARGIQHLYFKDYTADYIASTAFDVAGETGVAQVGMKNFFTAQTIAPLAAGATKRVLCYVHPSDAVVLSLGVTGTSPTQHYRFDVQLRKKFVTDRQIRLTSLRESDGIATAVWSNGGVLAIAPKDSGDKIAVDFRNAAVRVLGSLKQDGSEKQFLLVPASSADEAVAKARKLRQSADLEAAARDYWESWMAQGSVPKFAQDTPETAAYVEAYKRNIYCVKAAALNGQIPADITGQFVTNNMPQLYPRDAMMCARVLLLTGHAEEARHVIEFWANPKVPMKTPGEWYARYDAHGAAVDGGSGARFDEPEWDANGYFIYLVSKYHDKHGVWLVDRSLLYKLADFLVAHIGRNGLLKEGGIVEWTGYLPATNMICAAALKTASEIARGFGDTAREQRYTAASRQIAASLPETFDRRRGTYADVRFTGTKGANNQSFTDETGEKTYLWDTTANVGVIWGYPDHREIQLSNQFYDKNTVKLDGGMQYFDSPDPGLASYGHAVFFFTTAAAAQYQSLRGDKGAAKSFIDWMMRNANSYGLMPERIFLDDSDCSPASPLSWCSAEFAEALLLWSRTA
jgi:GH15 family glucan-1,4-alpha-glucosidase